MRGNAGTGRLCRMPRTADPGRQRAEPLRGGDQQADTSCPAIDPPLPHIDPLANRLACYAQIEAKHRLCGLASYYSTSLDGTLTAIGETYRNRRLTAAHMTLPLGSWVEVRARATGRKIRLRVNDRGPYVKKFCLDLSQAAARALGVDVAEDRQWVGAEEEESGVAQTLLSVPAQTGVSAPH